MVFTETLSWGLQQFFPTNTYAGISTTCVEFENVMKSATKKKVILGVIRSFSSFSGGSGNGGSPAKF